MRQTRRMNRKISKNTKIRQAIIDSGLRHWQIAAALEIDRSTLSKRLRFELTADEEAEIMQAIREAKAHETACV